MDSDNTIHCVERYAIFHAVAFVLHLSIHFHESSVGIDWALYSVSISSLFLATSR